MDQKRLSTSATANRSSALPRPVSRLPQPRASGIPTPASAIRTAPSAEGLRGRFAHPRTSAEPKAPEPTNGSRLRTPASREQLRATSTGPSTPSRRPPRLAGPPVSSTVALRGTKTRSISQEPRVGRTTQAALDGHLKQSPVVGRRPSGQSESSTLLNGSAIDEDGQHDASPTWPRPSDEDDTFDVNSDNSKPGLSLAERTMETLSHLTSPAAKRRGSNFFDPELASRRPSSRAASGSSRPGSSHQHDAASVRSLSRPGSRLGPSEGAYSSFRAPSSSHKPLPTGTQEAQFGTASGLVKPLSFRAASGAKRSSSNPPISAIGRRTPSPEDLEDATTKPETLTPVARSLRPKSVIPGLTKKISSTSLGKPSGKPSISPARRPRKGSATSTQSSTTINTNSSLKERNLSGASTVSTALTVDSVEDSPSVATAPKSSSALREQIAKAKAAKRAAAAKLQSPVTTGAPPLKSPLIPTDATFDFGLSEDPFNQGQFEDSNRKVMQSRITTARTTGRLNIAAMGLKQMPEEVLKMYDLESVGHGVSWAESVDLTRLIAADNELEVLDDSIFPDTDPMDFADDDEGTGHQFGGLEALDLHGNLLTALPLGLRRLQNLTSLNLAQNKLVNDSFDIISQIGSLRDLKLGGNLLKGKMDSCFASLVNLEALDLKGNEISALPDGFERLTRLRVLNLSNNSFESLPFDVLAQLPLTELAVHKNKLKGTLIDVEVEALPHLQTLDVSNNQLSLIALGPISMPSLLQLTVSMNRLNSLPDLSSWKSLLTINAAENSISSFPDGFLSSESIRSVDFTSNDIRVIPPEIARMDSLGLLRMAGNPLKDKKFISMTTEELKDSLAARLAPLPEEQGGVEQFGNEVESADHESYFYQPGKAHGPRDDHDDNESRSDTDNFATPPTSAPQSPVGARSRPLSTLTWPIKPGGILDRANTQSSSLNPVICSKLLAGDAVREIRLQHNTFTSFPDSLSFFADTLTSINISHNRLAGEAFMGEGFEFPALRELHIANNQITSLTPLITQLQAPNLQKLDISFNRIATLPVLRESFPSLDVLLVSNNKLEELDPTSVAGLRVVAADNNDIAHLNPRLGLLNLQRLEVSGNRFRVPRWDVLERGTEATLRWLRGRVPVAEVAEWKAKFGIKDEDDDFE